MRLRIGVHGVLALASLQPIAATAQPSSEEGAPSAAVTPPRLEHDPGVAYPKAALDAGIFETVRVDLIVEVAADGGVSHASVERPRHDAFDEAALAAARALRFTAARKAGASVPARIRFRYVFEPPPPILSGSVVADESGAALRGARVLLRAADGTEQVLETAPDGSFRWRGGSRGKLEVVFSAEGRTAQSVAVELEPGNETRIAVRLGAPSAPAPQAPAPEEELEVVVRGERLAPAVSSFSRAEVRELPGAFGDPFRAVEALPGVTPIGSGLPFFYVRGAPPGNVGYFLDGVRIPFLYHIAIGPSVIHPALVERVDLHPGGYPARFGRFAGGIVSAETTAPRAELHGEANVRLFDAGGLIETGFADGRGTILLGGRYSYTAALFSLLVPDLKLDYRDYQARVTYALTPSQRLSVFGLGSYDLLAQEQSSGLNVLFGAEFYRAGIRHQHDFDAGSLRTDVTFGYDQSHEVDAGNAIDRSVAVRSELRHALGRAATLRAGVDLALDVYTSTTPRYVDPDEPEVRAFRENNRPRTDGAAGVWTDVVLRPEPGVEVTPGVRLDTFRSGSASALAVDPRISARFAITEDLRIVHAYGLAHQPPAFVIPVPGQSPAGLEGGLQRSLQASAGVEADVARGTTATATVFYNAFFDMTDVLSTGIDGPPGLNADERSLGSAFGFELFVRRRLTERLGGFLSYTLSRSLRSLGREKFPSAFDRTHVLNAALAFDLGRSWRTGTRLVFYTGVPKIPEANGLIARPRSESRSRTDPFYRLDLRLEKRWDLGERTFIAFVAEFLNATLSKESFGDVEIGPITIPSLGAELGF